MQGWIVVQRRRDGSFDPVKAFGVDGECDAAIWWTRSEAETRLAMVPDETRHCYMVAPVLVQGLPPGDTK